jgi:hypothetical protein
MLALSFFEKPNMKNAETFLSHPTHAKQTLMPEIPALQEQD